MSIKRTFASDLFSICYYGSLHDFWKRKKTIAC